MTKIIMVFGILFFCVFSFVLPINANKREDPYQRIVLTLLAPNIDAQINKYYENKLTLIFQCDYLKTSLSTPCGMSHIIRAQK
jgi:hypothetical protein